MRVRACAPDLVVVDLILPDVDGMEGISRLKALQPDVRVILMSVITSHVELMRAAAVEAGAEDFVPKDDLNVVRLRSWKLQG